ncbi:hypothetical protein [Streptomyces mirabilis]|uniref:hypothetical protein n=1 Tax=Streptomyces mirabilis TaxID=68239 RepID=UPI0037FE7CC6
MIDLRRRSGLNNKKDPVETKRHTAACAGKVSLAAAQQAIVTDCLVTMVKRG